MTLTRHQPHRYQARSGDRPTQPCGRMESSSMDTDDVLEAPLYQLQGLRLPKTSGQQFFKSCQDRIKAYREPSTSDYDEPVTQKCSTASTKSPATYRDILPKPINAHGTEKRPSCTNGKHPSKFVFRYIDTLQDFTWHASHRNYWNRFSSYSLK